MNNTEGKINWDEIISLYNTTKLLYALCEETDPELKTNLQPLNEFRAALDHLMRVVAIEKTDEYNNKNEYEEATKLRSHLRRAFFDICDMLSINYRNKIIDTLEKYSTDEIQSAIPSYYSKIRPRLEEISQEISCLRTNKRYNGDEFAENAIEKYPLIIKELQEYYKLITLAETSLIEIHKKNKKNRRNNILVQYVLPIAAIVITIIIAVIGWVR